MLDYIIVILVLIITILTAKQVLRLLFTNVGKVIRIIVYILVVLLVLYGLWSFSRARIMQLFGNIISRVETEERIIALTFDDGPHPDYLDEILDILERNRIKATFFLTGREIEKYPSLAAQIADEGHEIGNHSYSHSRMAGKSYDFIAREIEKTDSLIAATGYSGEIYFRAPYCKKFATLPYYLWKNERFNITWGIEPESYPEIVQDREKLIEYTIGQSKPGSIILLHPMYKSGEVTRNALEELIIRLKEDGFLFLTISELLNKGN